MNNPSSPICFVGLDLSLTGTGIVALNSRGELVANQTLKPSKQTSKTKGPSFRVTRLIEIRDKINTLITHLPPGPQTMFAIESYTYGTNNSAHILGELGGVVRTLLYEHNFPYIEVAPAHVKKYATGAGNAKKEQVIAWVLKRWGLLFSTSDEADAYVLARMLYDQWGNWGEEGRGWEAAGLIEAQREVLQKLGDVVYRKAV